MRESLSWIGVTHNNNFVGLFAFYYGRYFVPPTSLRTNFGSGLVIVGTEMAILGQECFFWIDVLYVDSLLKTVLYLGILLPPTALRLLILGFGVNDPGTI